MEIAHRNVADQYQAALSGDADAGVGDMIDQVAEVEDEGNEDKDPFDDLLNAMDPRTSKGEVVSNGDDDE
jgi:hypothetical protein